MIELRSLHRTFGQTRAVNDISFEVPKGTVLGYVGPNGAGKTTLLKLILGQEQPDAGTVKQGSKLQIAYFDQMREQLDDQERRPGREVADQCREDRQQAQPGLGQLEIVGEAGLGPRRGGGFGVHS